MADVTLADVLQGRGQQANDFGRPLTPEQEALMKRGVTTETINPLELLIGGSLGGLAGRAMGRGMGHAGAFFAGARQGGGVGAANIAGRVGGGLGALSGVGGAMDAARERAYANTIRDAEGQPDGYYGEPRK